MHKRKIYVSYVEKKKEIKKNILLKLKNKTYNYE